MHLFSFSRLEKRDLLSPYLFLFCAKGLSSLLDRSDVMGETQGVAVACGEQHISHLFFTDDSLIFYKASLKEWAKVKNILNIYA